MQSGQRSPAQEPTHELSSRLDAFGRAGEPAPAAHTFGVQQHAARMLPYSRSVQALPERQQLGAPQQAAGAQRRLQCMSNWSRSVLAMNAAPLQLQPQQRLHRPLSSPCAALPGTGDAAIVSSILLGHCLIDSVRGLAASTDIHTCAYAATALIVIQRACRKVYGWTCVGFQTSLLKSSRIAEASCA